MSSSNGYLLPGFDFSHCVPTTMVGMELLRRAGLDAKLRSVAIPETHGFDVSWVTTVGR